jgi:phosphohistidine phosphatase
MSRELLLLRHAKSAWDTNARSDFERPLAKRGLQAAPKVGRFLASKGLTPDYVVSSPAERARQTVILACEEMGVAERAIHWDPRIYLAGTRMLIDVLRDAPPQAGRVLMTGHNPGFEQLLRTLCAEPLAVPGDGKLMPTAAVARLEITVPWRDLEEGVARLLSLTRSRSL